MSGIEKLLRYFLVFPYLIIKVKGKPQHTNSKRKMPEHSDSLAMKVWVTLSDKRTPTPEDKGNVEWIIKWNHRYQLQPCNHYRNKDHTFSASYKHGFICMLTIFFSLPLLFLIFISYWSIIGLQCHVSFRGTAKWFQLSFSDSFPMQVITEYRVACCALQQVLTDYLLFHIY